MARDPCEVIEMGASYDSNNRIDLNYFKTKAHNSCHQFLACGNRIFLNTKMLSNVPFPRRKSSILKGIRSVMAHWSHCQIDLIDYYFSEETLQIPNELEEQHTNAIASTRTNAFNTYETQYANICFSLLLRTLSQLFELVYNSVLKECIENV